MEEPAHRRTAFLEGFALLVREPLLLPVELLWRWAFGFSAWGLALLSGAAFLDSFKLSPSDALLLNTLQPQSIAAVLRHVFRGSLLRFTWMQAILLIGLAVLWAAVAAAGRSASLNRMFSLLRVEEPGEVRWHFWSIFALNLLRSLWNWIAWLAATASLVLGGIMVRQQRAAAAAFFLVFGTVLSIVFGILLSRFLGLAPLFCVRNHSSASQAIGDVVEFCAARGGQIAGLSSVFGFLRAIWFGTMFFAFVAPLRLIGKVAPSWVLMMMAIVALLYFAGSDALQLARTGAYAAFTEAPEPPPPVILPEPEPPPSIAYLPEPNPL